MVLLPELLKSSREDLGAVKAAAAAAAPVKAAVAAAAVPGLPPALPAVKQQGGAAAGSIPPLHEVAAGLLDPSTVIRGQAELGAPFRSTVITGGGKAANGKVSTADSAVFVGVLGLAALAGLGLAVVRSKADSPV